MDGLHIHGLPYFWPFTPRQLRRFLALLAEIASHLVLAEGVSSALQANESAFSMLADPTSIAFLAEDSVASVLARCSFVDGATADGWCSSRSNRPQWRESGCKWGSFEVGVEYHLLQWREHSAERTTMGLHTCCGFFKTVVDVSTVKRNGLVQTQTNLNYNPCCGNCF